MCLQTYIYYYCRALLYALVERDTTNATYYGVCCTVSLCERWNNFFAPQFLQSSMVESDSGARWAAWQLDGIIKVIRALKDSCSAYADAMKSKDVFAIRLNKSLLRCTLEEIVLPELKEFGYDDEEGAHIVYFDATDSYLTSFTPVAGTKCFDGVPGIYNKAEECVTLSYLRAIRNAPTMVTLSGVSEGEEPRPLLVELSMITERENALCGLAHFTYRGRPETEVAMEVYNQWSR